MAEDPGDPYGHFEQRNFATYYGGQAMTPPGQQGPFIHKLIADLRFAIGGVKAERAKGVMFPVKSAKDLMDKFSQALHDLNAISYVVHSEFHHSPFAWTKIDRETQKPVSGTGTMIHCKSVVRIAASDGSYVDFIGSGHGQDRDDKAGGKASTYAWKDAILKGLCLGENDVEDTDNESGTGTGASNTVVSNNSAPVASNAQQPSVASDETPAPKRRGRPPGSGKKTAAAESAPAAVQTTNAPNDQFILDTIKKLENAKTLEEVYRIRDEDLKPKDKSVQNACTPTYIKMRDKYKTA